MLIDMLCKRLSEQGLGRKKKKQRGMTESEEGIDQLEAGDLLEMEDLWAKLPDEVQQKIFKLLRWRQLFRVCAVCKSFNEGINRYVHDLPLFRTALPVSKR
ncbi:hypothetical protein KC19_6G088500 [Ceratodon purpureus]|uniref:F-box domain-containing protein n=1 Tax=Ceratodon purpureus TaxID=3225 RepID=A0A8T0HCA8_CERPU|nr:hypothetical protein KC19_6G088500 [Ceratodon purpureus]KAG0569412.1 hypothetical protein KC19_6G088500 [Ceratodon purpureus]